MTGDERIEEFKKLSREELRRIATDPFSSEIDFIAASVELGHRDIVAGNVYTPEEVLEHVLGKNNMVNKSARRLSSNS